MLPWLQNKEASASSPVESVEREPDEPTDEYDSMHACAEDLINAIHSKDIQATAEALRAAFELSKE